MHHLRRRDIFAHSPRLDALQRMKGPIIGALSGGLVSKQLPDRVQTSIGFKKHLRDRERRRLRIGFCIIDFIQIRLGITSRGLFTVEFIGPRQGRLDRKGCERGLPHAARSRMVLWPPGWSVPYRADHPGAADDRERN
jgi:hypothetical protein